MGTVTMATSLLLYTDVQIHYDSFFIIVVFTLWFLKCASVVNLYKTMVDLSSLQDNILGSSVD